MSHKLPSFLKKLDADFARLASEEESAAEFGNYIDTGVYSLNMLLSGRFDGGFADNKILALAGESSVGKTYFSLSIVKSFLTQNPTGVVIYLDTEAAVTQQMFLSRGIDTSRVMIAVVDTVEQFRTKMYSLLDGYEQEEDRVPMLVVLDSLGILSTEKEMQDSKDGEFVKDMTRSQAVRAAFRVLRLKLAKLHVPMIVVSHSYAQIGTYGTPQTVSGGGGLKYASDIILMLSKKQGEKGEDGELQSVIIKAKLEKSRLTREKKHIETMLSYSTGLDRFYGLAELAIKAGVVTEEGRSYKFSNGTKATTKAVEEEPEKYWTPEVLKAIEAVVAPDFLYHSVGSDTK